MSSPPGADKQCTLSRPSGPTSTFRKPLPGKEGQSWQPKAIQSPVPAASAPEGRRQDTRALEGAHSLAEEQVCRSPGPLTASPTAARLCVLGKQRPSGQLLDRCKGTSDRAFIFGCVDPHTHLGGAGQGAAPGKEKLEGGEPVGPSLGTSPNNGMGSILFWVETRPQIPPAPRWQSAGGQTSGPRFAETTSSKLGRGGAVGWPQAQRCQEFPELSREESGPRAGQAVSAQPPGPSWSGTAQEAGCAVHTRPQDPDGHRSQEVAQAGLCPGDNAREAGARRRKDVRGAHGAQEREAMEVFKESLIRDVTERKCWEEWKEFSGRHRKFRPEVMRAAKRDGENR
uniref:Uncharacterized protein n=1 Tax=Rangifer tarandus platyrhynchus TaxID=3082113 RepID=A0ACB0DQ55_RANTA|nr:unnamed protein product [Rangifer tarandus platyrhynchus]